MNLRDALHVWRRRWILTLLLILLVLAVSAAAAMKLPRHYSAESDVVLLPSASSAAPNGHNPYLSFNGSLPMTAQVITYQLMAPGSVQSLAAQGYRASYAVTLAANAAGAPVVDVLVTGSNKAAVENTLHGVTNEIATNLTALQTGISHNNRITALTLSVAMQPSLSTSKTARPLVVVLGLGLVLALSIPLMVDGVARRRTPDRATIPASHSAYTPLSDAALPLRAPSDVRRPSPDGADPSLDRSVYRPARGSNRR